MLATLQVVKTDRKWSSRLVVFQAQMKTEWMVGMCLSMPSPTKYDAMEIGRKRRCVAVQAVRYTCSGGTWQYTCEDTV